MITILCAMQPEADAIIKALEMKSSVTPWDESLPPKLWKSEHFGKPMTLVTNGFDPKTNANLIGTTPATFATQLIVQHLNPSLILVAGAAGGCSQKTSIGQTLLIEKAFHHDRRIPLQEFEQYAIGSEQLHVPPGFDLPLRNISTGNSLDTLDHEIEFFRKHNVTVKDMETASIVWTASLTNTKVSAIRSITDFYDHPTPENQFLVNFDLALSNLASTIRENIEILIEGLS